MRMEYFKFLFRRGGNPVPETPDPLGSQKKQEEQTDNPPNVGTLQVLNELEDSAQSEQPWSFQSGKDAHIGADAKKKQRQLKGNRRQQIKCEPRLQVMPSDFSGTHDELVCFGDEASEEVDEDVDQEGHVDEVIDHCEENAVNNSKPNVHRNHQNVVKHQNDD